VEDTCGATTPTARVRRSTGTAAAFCSKDGRGYCSILRAMALMLRMVGTRGPRRGGFSAGTPAMEATAHGGGTSMPTPGWRSTSTHRLGGVRPDACRGAAEVAASGLGLLRFAPRRRERKPLPRRVPAPQPQTRVVNRRPRGSSAATPMGGAPSDSSRLARRRHAVAARAVRYRSLSAVRAGGGATARARAALMRLRSWRWTARRCWRSSTRLGQRSRTAAPA